MKKITATTYKIELKDDLYNVTEQVSEMEAIDVVYSWKCSHDFQEIPPLFQYTPSHLVKDFEDLKLFHESLDKVLSAAYQFMGNMITQMPALAAFKTNFELVEVCLNEIEEKIRVLRTSSEKGQGLLDIYKEKVLLLNNTIKSLMSDHLVCFGDMISSSKLVWKAAAPEVKISPDGLTASKAGSCSYSVVAADIGWKTGAHEWTINAKQISCYDTIGVCDETFFEEKDKPLLVGFGTYPGSHRAKDGPGIKFVGTSILPTNTSVKCILDLGSKFEFSFQIVGKEDLYTLSLEEFGYRRGTKLYPALTLCNSSSYSFVQPKQ